MFQILLQSEVADLKFTVHYFCIKVSFMNLKTSFVVCVLLHGVQNFGSFKSQGKIIPLHAMNAYWELRYSSIDY